MNSVQQQYELVQLNHHALLLEAEQQRHWRSPAVADQRRRRSPQSVSLRVKHWVITLTIASQAGGRYEPC